MSSFVTPNTIDRSDRSEGKVSSTWRLNGMISHAICVAISKAEYLKSSVTADKVMGYKISKKKSNKKTSRQGIIKVADLYFNKVLWQE